MLSLIEIEAEGDPGCLFLPTQKIETSWVDPAKRHAFLALDPGFLSTDTVCEFPIYVYNSARDRFVLLKAADLPITQRHLEQIRSTRHGPVFVPRDYARTLTTYAADNLKLLAGNTSVSASTRSRQVYSVSRALFAGAFSESCDDQELEGICHRVTEAMVTLLDSGSEALRHLILAQSHDPAVYVHSLNVCILGTSLFDYLHSKCGKEERLSVAQGFLLHDIGKTDISPEIWTKPGKLTPEEYEHVKQHPVHGFKRVKRMENLTERTQRIVLEHHEHCDGSGYPSGLTCDGISVEAQICAIVETFEDLTSERPYHASLPVFQALRLMQIEGRDKLDVEIFKGFIHFFRSLSGSSNH